VRASKTVLKFEQFFFDETFTLIRDGRPILGVTKLADGFMSVMCNAGGIVSPNDFENQEMLNDFWTRARSLVNG
jgi:hypothetical protein